MKALKIILIVVGTVFVFHWIFGDDSTKSKTTDGKVLESSVDDKVKAQFSAWDGSHIQLERMIKKSMNDPDSYKHIETNYWIMKKDLIVATTYTGTNAYGGRVKGFCKAKFTLDGDFVEVIEER